MCKPLLPLMVICHLYPQHLVLQKRLEKNMYSILMLGIVKVFFFKKLENIKKNKNKICYVVTISGVFTVQYNNGELPQLWDKYINFTHYFFDFIFFRFTSDFLFFVILLIYSSFIFF